MAFPTNITKRTVIILNYQLKATAEISLQEFQQKGLESMLCTSEDGKFILIVSLSQDMEKMSIDDFIESFIDCLG